jgi:hypothetical protein
MNMTITEKNNAKLTPLVLLMLVSLLPFSGIAAEPVKGVQIPSAIDLTLPIHQKPKLHPELSDPVLGDQAQIVEWAWSPQYAERFGLQPQPDGLPNGELWLVGVKIERKQNHQWQIYTCTIVGVMDNRLKIVVPPGERFLSYPNTSWSSEFPGKFPVKEEILHQIEQRNFAPGFQTWRKQPKSERQKQYPGNSDGMVRYTTFIRQFTETLSYFEALVGCSYFGAPALFRNEIRFPTRIDGKNDDDPKVGAVFEPTAIRFDLPDNLMRRIYPYTLEADDWTSFFMHRSGRIGRTLSIRAKKSKRFGNTCEPITQKQK